MSGRCALDVINITISSNARREGPGGVEYLASLGVWLPTPPPGGPCLKKWPDLAENSPLPLAA